MAKEKYNRFVWKEGDVELIAKTPQKSSSKSTRKKSSVPPKLVTMYGSLWARNKINLSQLQQLTKHSTRGVYVLRDGSMPVYVGRGNLWKRINSHTRSKTKRDSWDQFSWYVIPESRYAHEIEAMALRMLPFYLRTFNRQKGNFFCVKGQRQEDPAPDPIRRPSFKLQKATNKARS
jgi:hypothetical protein